MLAFANELRAIAADYASHGLGVIPGLPGSKKPAISWRPFQWEAPTAAEREAMFSTQHDLNIGVICGAASLNLVVLDAETPSAFRETVRQCERAGFGDTWIDKTPRGGHVWLRTPVPVKPIKGSPVEVRGQGQYILVPPSFTTQRYEFLQRPPSIAQVPSLEALDWLKLEAAPHGHDKRLPRKAERLLQGEHVDQYSSRSEAEQAILTVLVNAGFSFNEVVAIFQTYPAAGKFNEKSQREGLKQATSWLRIGFDRARAWCAGESPAKALAREALAHAMSIPWPGRTGSTNRSVFCAHTTLAYRSGQYVYHASSRDIAEIAGCGKKTALIANRRLVKAGLVRLVKPSAFTFANRYKLTLPEGKKTKLTPFPKNTCEGVGSTSSFLLPDAFRKGGFGRSAYEVLVALDGKALTAGDIAERTGRHIQTVRKVLAKIRHFGLVEKQSCVWRGFAFSEIDLQALAEKLGTNGARRQQRDKHHAERLKHRISQSVLRDRQERKPPRAEGSA